MNLTGLIGKKIGQKQGFLEDGTRVPLSMVDMSNNIITQIKKVEGDGYHAIQLGFGTRKRANKALVGHSKKAGLEKTPRFFREIRLADTTDAVQGATVAVADIFKPGDVIDVTGTSKGKGFAGVVKRHHFRGGPRTHGQSDRERAPGSIGQTTTPGRVYRGKRMAGHMGNVISTVKNLEVLDVVGDTLIVKGLVPGPKGSILTIIKKGQNKKFKPLFKKAEEVKIEEVANTEKSTEAQSEEGVETQALVEETVVEEKPEEKKEEEAK